MNTLSDYGRFVLPPKYYFLYTQIPIALLVVLGCFSTALLSNRIRQLLSIPLLVTAILLPYFLVDKEHGMIWVVVPLINFTVSIRLINSIWISPILFNGKPVLSLTSLKKEIMLALKKTSRGETKQVDHIKNKRYYHLFTPMFINCIMVDMIIVYVRTITEEDLVRFYHDPVRYMLLLLSLVTGLTTFMNLLGQSVQLIYCIVYDHGYYAPAEWRPVMDYPIIGSSLMDIWSNRWHRVFRPIWVMLAYKPIYHFIQKWSQNSKTGKKFATLFASLGVFFISGLTHEYIVFCLAGWPIYQERYMGQQIMFFTTHGIFVIAEKIIGQSMRSVLPTHIRQSFLVKILLHLYVVTVVYYTFPYFLNGFAFWGMHRLENLFVFGTLFKRFLHNTPFLHPFCGSNV